MIRLPSRRGRSHSERRGNHHRWANYEWSESMWAWAIQPRISPFLPSAHTLEIAPGFGRATQFLLPASAKRRFPPFQPGLLPDQKTGELTIGNEHWRATSMSAAKFQRFSAAAGLRCVAQELIPWGGTDFTDGISVFRREAGRSRRHRSTQIRNNRYFGQVQQRRAAGIREVTSLYRDAA
ncbi:hypothetical protein AB0F52_37265 [Amycolatopsis sp. NPDC024027]|uniref:hypothetical protein n=1 Tax=Amycolatopsis sp. NPDC024027 TaxID=3154327 RepID=UPI0033D318E9